MTDEPTERSRSLSRLRIRVVVVLSVVLAVPSITVGLLLSSWTAGKVEEQSLEILRNAAATAEADISAQLTQVQTQLEMLDGVVQIATEDDDERSRTMDVVVGRNPIYQGLTWVDIPSGRSLHVSRSGSLAWGAPTAAQIRDLIAETAASDSFKIGPVTIDPDLREPLSQVAWPVIDPRSGDRSGLLIATLRFSEIWDLLGEIDVQEDAGVYLIDGDGRVLAHRNPTIVLAGTVLPSPGAEGRSVGLVAPEVLAAVQPLDIPGSELVVVAEQSTAAALRTARTIGGVVLALIIVGLVVTLLLALTAVGRIIEPLEDLAASADRIAAGDLSHRADTMPRDEIGRLAMSFNTMTQRLVDTIGSLEARVGQRTAELEEANALKDHLIEQLSIRADQDSLTGLANRRSILERLAEEHLRAARSGSQAAVLLVDLDNFKEINDTFGHVAGDDVLIAVGERLDEVIRDVDAVGRLGGDEFMVVQSGVRGADDAAHLAERVIDALQPVVQAGEGELAVRCSIGIALSGDAESAQQMSERADIALYRAKLSGDGGYRFFELEMEGDVSRRVTISRDLRLAIDRDELFLEFQPQVRLGDRTIVGVEALLRWRHEVLGLVGPREIVAIAEGTGHFAEIGAWVLRAACEQARDWAERELPLLPVSVNIAASQVRAPEFVGEVARTLHACGLAAEHLELEMAEEVLIEGGEPVRAALEELRDMGVGVCVDGFGRDHGALLLLLGWPLTKVKLDPSLTAEIVTDRRRRATMQAIIDLTSELEVSVTATGVEPAAVLTALERQRCEIVQGYYFCPPLSAEALEALARVGSDRIALPVDGVGGGPP